MQKHQCTQRMVENLEKQLHEQYAINNNSNLSSALTLLCTLLAVIGVYGYVLIYSDLKWATDIGRLELEGHYAIDVLLYTTIAAYYIVFVLYYICAFLGAGQRREQFIIDSIRRKAFPKRKDGSGEPVLEDFDIFPENYHPYGKTKTEFIQGLYGEFMHFLVMLSVIITVMTAVKVGHATFGNDSHWVLLTATAAACILLFVSFRAIVNVLYEKYVKANNTFLKKRFPGCSNYKEISFGRIENEITGDKDCKILKQSRCCLCFVATALEKFLGIRLPRKHKNRP